MSNKLNRKARRANERAIKETLLQKNQARLHHHLVSAEAEMRDVMEHEFGGMWFSCMAIAMARCRLSVKTIDKAMTICDQLYGELTSAKLSMEELAEMAKEEAGVQVVYNVERKYMELSPFEEGKSPEKHWDNLTLIKRMMEEYD